MKVINNWVLYAFLLMQLYRPLLIKILVGVILLDFLVLFLIAVFSPDSMTKALQILEGAQTVR